jgi:hypothetical protein
MFEEGQFVAVKTNCGEVKGEICHRFEHYRDGLKFRVRYYDVSLRRPDDLWCREEDMTLCEPVDWLTGETNG